MQKSTWTSFKIFDYVPEKNSIKESTEQKNKKIYFFISSHSFKSTFYT